MAEVKCQECGRIFPSKDGWVLYLAPNAHNVDRQNRETICDDCAVRKLQARQIMRVSDFAFEVV